MGPVLGFLPSEVVVGSSQLLQLPEHVGTCCKGCIQSSGLQGISVLWEGNEGDPWRFRGQVLDWEIECESCWDPLQPAHIGETILGSLIKFGSVLHTSRGDGEI